MQILCHPIPYLRKANFIPNHSPISCFWVVFIWYSKSKELRKLSRLVFFCTMALYLGRRSSVDESKLYKDEPKRWINSNFRSDFFLSFGRWWIKVKIKCGNDYRTHWGFLAGWLLVTHITHSIKVAEGKKAHGMLGSKTRCESCGSSVGADWRGRTSTWALMQEKDPDSRL